MPRINKKRRAPYSSDTNVTENQFVNISPKNPETYSFFRQLEMLLDDERLCDVTFRIGTQSFKAHRVILAASNSFLGVMMLTSMNESSQSVIDISPDTDPRLFRLILDFIYGKKIQVPISLVCPLLALANCYTLPLLRDRLAEYLKSTTNIDNCCSIYALADSHNCANLRDYALNMIFEYFGAVSRSDSFLDLNQEQMEFILASDQIIDCPEISIFEASTRWLTHVTSQRSSLSSSNTSQEFQTTIVAIMKLIRFPLIDSNTLSEVVKLNPYMMGGMELMVLLLEAFEYHALKTHGGSSVTNSRMVSRKKSCPFTRPLLLDGHKDSVSAMVCYGEYLITGSWDSTIKVWEQSKRNHHRQVSSPGLELQQSHQQSHPSIGLHPSTSTSQLSDLAGSSRGSSPFVEGGVTRINQPELSDWHCVKTLEVHSGAIRSLCVCNDMIVSCSDDGIMNVWHPRTWTKERTMEAHDGAANAVIEVICGGISASDMIILDEDTPPTNHSVENDSIRRLVSAGDDGTIKIWNTSTWVCEITLHNDLSNQDDNTPLRVGVLSLEVWKSYLFSGGDDNVVRVWSTINWTCVHLLRAHEDEVWSLRVLPDGTLVTGSVDATIRVWRCRPFENVTQTVDTSDHTMISANEDRVTNVLSLSINDHLSHQSKYLTWECEQIISSDGPVYSLCFLDNRLISAGASKRISVWCLSPSSLSTSFSTSANSSSNININSNINTNSSSSSNVNINTNANLNSSSRVNVTKSNDQVSWSLLKHFDTIEEGVWSLTVHKDHLISGGCEGTVLFWV